MSVVSDVIQSTVAILKGMKRTLSEIPRAKWTVQYPDVPITVQPRYRGQHLLHVDEAGKEKCVACYLCAAACPSDCIYIEAETDPRPYAERIGRDERYAKVYTSITAAVSFAVSVLRLARRTGSHTGLDLRSQFITDTICEKTK